MAATTIKPYPHIQINVKDNSIATIEFVETLPVHRALYVMRTKKGPLCEPTWCNTYSEAAALFGAETFDPANKKYFSRSSLYLRNTLTRNGAFITRYLPADSSTANIVLYAEVQEETGIPQYQYVEGTGYRKEQFVPGKVLFKRAASPTDNVVCPKPKDANTHYYRLNDDGTYSIIPTLEYSVFVAAGANFQELGGPAGVDIYIDSIETGSWEFVQKTGNDATASGVSIRYYTKKLTDEELASFDGKKKVSNGIITYPIAIFQAKYAGEYGNDLAFKLFYTPKSNDAGDVNAYGTLFYNIGFAEREDTQSTWNPIADIYNRENCAFAANQETVNPDTGAPMSIDYVLDKSFSDSAHNLPVKFDLFENNINEIGLIIAAFEDDVADDNGVLITAASLNGYDSFSKVGALTSTDKGNIIAYLRGGAEPAILGTSQLGYKVNIISGKNLLDVPYDHVKIDTDGDNTVALNMSYNIALEGGSDGTINKDDDTANWASDDKAMYDFCKLKLRVSNAEDSPKLTDRIVESLRFPVTHLFDIGYSMKTKKAMLDFLDVRDDVVVILSAQVLMSDGSGRSLKINDMATDEANTEALRSYALLMRESVLYGTDCMRASIYEHTGKLVNSTFDGYVPFTYWVAEQYAQYGNLTYMSTAEPRGLPYSYNLLFKEWNWNNYRADSQSRVWDEGGNYVQYADMTRLFYPSLRTVYRAATSVLVDEWVVAAVVYAKYVVRRAWARFSGRNDYASILQDAIKKYIDAEIAALFNNKYTFNTTVYQTAEEQELGYIQHVKLSITFGATMRVLDVDIEVNREGFTPEE